MSVIKSKRGESPVQFIETAGKLEVHTFSVVTKVLRRYDPYLLYKLTALATTVRGGVQTANNVYPRNQREVQARRDCPTRADIALQNLSPKPTLLYDAILQNPEKCPWIGHTVQEFGEYIKEETKLITRVEKADSERHKDLPV